MSIYSTIYKCTNLITNECYIGYDSNWPSRKVKHLYDVSNTNSKNYNCHFYRAIRKYGIESFYWNIIYQSKDKEHCLNEMESHFINEFDSFNNGYNMTKGGEGTLGKKSWLGRKHSIETKLKISNSAKGKIRSKEHSENISKSKLGKKIKPFTDEHKKKISESIKKKLSSNLF
jgi:group I intron endonuclease